MDVTVHRFSETWREGWEAFIEATPAATLAHADAWLWVISRALDHQDRSLVAERGGEVCGVLPMMLLGHWLFGTLHVSLPWLDYGGIIADDPDVCRHLLESAVTQATADGASVIELRSVEKMGPELPTRDDKVTLHLELGSSKAVWGRLNPKVRNQVRKAQRAGLTCQFGREELLPDFYRVFARNMRDLGTPVWGAALFGNILERFPKTAEIALIRLGEKPVGAGLALSFKDTVYMPSASSLRPYFHFCPNNLLYWEVIKRACEAGYRRFDFGRSTIGSGTYHFKKQWGAAVKPLRWQYVFLKGKKMPRLNPMNRRLRVFREVWKRLPVRVATWLGPRIVRHLP